MKLMIGSHISPFVRKVRIVMAEKKIDCELVLENVWASDTKIHDFNPLGKLLPQERRERTEVKCWEALADGMLDAAVLIRLEGTMREWRIAVNLG